MKFVEREPISPHEQDHTHAGFTTTNEVHAGIVNFIIVTEDSSSTSLKQVRWLLMDAEDERL